MNNQDDEVQNLPVGHHWFELAGKLLVSADDNDNDHDHDHDDDQLFYKAHEARVYTTDDNDYLTAEDTLSELKKILDTLVKLQRTRDIGRAIDKTEKLIKLGELQISECMEEMFDWYGGLIEQHDQNPNFVRFVKHFSEELNGLCDQFYRERNLRLKWLSHLPPPILLSSP